MRRCSHAWKRCDGFGALHNIAVYDGRHPGKINVFGQEYRQADTTANTGISGITAGIQNPACCIGS